ncbi:MAG TPA: pitrilysin family protein [Polyangiaceae bacterium]
MRAPALLVPLLAVALPASARAASPPLPHHVCPDGLEVVVSENHATPLVTVEIGVHEGSMTESPDYNGLSHLYEHMFFKGNAAMPDQLAYLARLRALGAEFNGTTWIERVNYFFTTTSDHLAGAMVFMRDAIVTPLFDPKEFERERVVVTGEIDRNESEPNYHLWHAIEKKVFWKYPSRKDALGTRAAVLSATTEKMRTIQKRYYVPNNSILVVTGDVHADDVFMQADRLYAGWAHADDPFVKNPLPKHPPIRTSEVVLIAQPVENFNAVMEWQGPSTLDESARDTYAADLLAALVNDPGSRFQKTLVDSGACVRASMGYFTEAHTGEVSVDFEATPDKVDACVGALAAELPKLKTADYFADPEMKNAVHRIEVNRMQERETTSGRAHAITWAWATSTLDYDATYEDRVRALTRSDLAGYLDRWVLGRPFVLGAMASQKQLDGGLTRQRVEKLIGIGAGKGDAGGKR